MPENGQTYIFKISKICLITIVGSRYTYVKYFNDEYATINLVNVYEAQVLYNISSALNHHF